MSLVHKGQHQRDYFHMFSTVSLNTLSLTLLMVVVALKQGSLSFTIVVSTVMLGRMQPQIDTFPCRNASCNHLFKKDKLCKIQLHLSFTPLPNLLQMLTRLKSSYMRWRCSNHFSPGYNITVYNTRSLDLISWLDKQWCILRSCDSSHSSLKLL